MILKPITYHMTRLSPYSESARAVNDPNSDEQDAVQNFLRGAEEENASFDPVPTTAPAPIHNDSHSLGLAIAAAYSGNAITSQDHDLAGHPQDLALPGHAMSAPQPASAPVADLPASNLDVLQTLAGSISDPDFSEKPNSSSDQAGIDYQSLLDTISQSASTAPAADPVSAPTTASAQDPATHNLPIVPGLPPKPPRKNMAQRIPFLHMPNLLMTINPSRIFTNHQRCHTCPLMRNKSLSPTILAKLRA